MNSRDRSETPLPHRAVTVLDKQRELTDVCTDCFREFDFSIESLKASDSILKQIRNNPPDFLLIDSDCLDGGLIGDVVVMHYTGRWAIAEDWFRSGRPGWFADPQQVPGGAFIDEGIYAVEQLRWLAGSEVVQVEAKMANLVHKDIAVEDWGMATLTFANGVVATLEASWTVNSPQKTGPSPKQNSVVRLEIVGSRGEVIEDQLRVPGRAVLAAGAPGWVFERTVGEPFGPPAPGPLAYLIDCLEADRQPTASIQEARRSFVVAMAAYESARQARPVQLSW